LLYDFTENTEAALLTLARKATAQQSPHRGTGEAFMFGSRHRWCAAALVGGVALVMGGCASSQNPSGSFGTSESSPPPPPPVAALPPAFPPEDIVGRWGFASFHKEGDRPRTEKAAKAQCDKPYVINRGPTGGVMMHLADDSKPSELRLKGAAGNKTYIGPDGEVGGPQDREVVSFDGRVLVLRWMDPEVGGRYGTGVYVRCGARA
jgi:hypothetical protein